MGATSEAYSRWVNAAALAIADRIQYAPWRESSFGCHRPGPLGCACTYWPLPDGSGALRATRAWQFIVQPSRLARHLRYKEHGLPASTLQRPGACVSAAATQALPQRDSAPAGGGAARAFSAWPAEVLRRAPMYVAAATAGLTCRADVVARPDGFEIILSDCDSSTRDGLCGQVSRRAPYVLPKGFVGSLSRRSSCLSTPSQSRGPMGVRAVRLGWIRTPLHASSELSELGPGGASEGTPLRGSVAVDPGAILKIFEAL